MKQFKKSKLCWLKKKHKSLETMISLYNLLQLQMRVKSRAREALFCNKFPA